MPPDVWVALTLAISFSAAAAVFDYRTGLIPNWLNYGALALAALVHGVGLTGYSFSASALGFVSLFVPLFVMFVMRSIGGGDVKLLATLGAILAWPASGSLLFWSVVFAALYALIYMIHRAGVLRIWKRLAWFFAALFYRHDVSVGNSEALTIPLAIPVFFAVLSVSVQPERFIIF
jgi:prepilin peptidase CpaA